MGTDAVGDALDPGAGSKGKQHAAGAPEDVAIELEPARGAAAR
jgi:hypothetical protein